MSGDHPRVHSLWKPVRTTAQHRQDMLNGLSDPAPTPAQPRESGKALQATTGPTGHQLRILQLHHPGTQDGTQAEMVQDLQGQQGRCPDQRPHRGPPVPQVPEAPAGSGEETWRSSLRRMSSRSTEAPASARATTPTEEVRPDAGRIRPAPASARRTLPRLPDGRPGRQGLVHRPLPQVRPSTWPAVQPVQRHARTG